MTNSSVHRRSRGIRRGDRSRAVHRHDIARRYDDPAAVLSQAGDLGPEGLAFIAGPASATGEPLLAVANEVSGTTTLFAIDSLTP